MLVLHVQLSIDEFLAGILHLVRPFRPIIPTRHSLKAVTSQSKTKVLRFTTLQRRIQYIAIIRGTVRDEKFFERRKVLLNPLVEGIPVDGRIAL